MATCCRSALRAKQARPPLSLLSGWGKDFAKIKKGECLLEREESGDPYEEEEEEEEGKGVMNLLQEG